MRLKRRLTQFIGFFRKMRLIFILNEALFGAERLFEESGIFPCGSYTRSKRVLGSVERQTAGFDLQSIINCFSLGQIYGGQGSLPPRLAASTR